MSRTTYRQDKETGKFIELHEWVEKYGADPRSNTNIIKSLEAFKSPIDGSIINTRQDLANHNQKHNVTNIADYGAGHFEKRGAEMADIARGTNDKARAERKVALDKELRRRGV